MNRRQFIKRSTMACAAVALLPGHLPAQAEKTTAPASSGTPDAGASGTGKLPDYAKDMLLHSDMEGLGPDGNRRDLIRDHLGHCRGDVVPTKRR